MAQIKFNATEVSSTITGLSETYSYIKEKINELNDEKANLSSFWSSKEASLFATQLEKVQSDLNEFTKKYDGYIAFLDSVISAYGKDESDFIATINSIAASRESNDD